MPPEPEDSHSWTVGSSLPPQAARTAVTATRIIRRMGATVAAEGRDGGELAPTLRDSGDLCLKRERQPDVGRRAYGMRPNCGLPLTLTVAAGPSLVRACV